jgi:hypothetical protein
MPGYPLKITDAEDQKSRLYFAFITQYLLGTSALVEVSLSVPLRAEEGGSIARMFPRDFAKSDFFGVPHWS